MNGRFDDAVYSCLVSPAVSSLFSTGPPLMRGTVQALFCGMPFTAEVPVEVADIDCDLIVGREWIALFRLVTNERPVAASYSRDDVIPSIEESSMNFSPLPGCISVASAADHSFPLGTVSEVAAQREESVRMLDAALHSDVPTAPSWTMLHFDVDLLRRCCASHGIQAAGSDGGGYGDALLRHFFTGMCMLIGPGDDDNGLACNDVRRGLRDRTELISILIGSVLRPDIRYSTDRLSMIARAVGLVESGTKVERRKLVSMLEEFNLGCNSARYHDDVRPEALFSNIDRITRPSLLALGCAHGITLASGREGLLDALKLHVASGACAVHSRTNHPLPVCVGVVRHYMAGLPPGSLDSEDLQIRILDAVCQFIKQRPLKRLLRLPVQDVSFVSSSGLLMLRRSSRTYVNCLKKHRDDLEPQVTHPHRPVLIPDPRKTDIVRRFRQ